MWDIIGWIAWGVTAFLAISFALTCRVRARSGKGFQRSTATQTFAWWLIASLFLIFDWNKVHILWITPLSFFAAQFLALSDVPVLSTLSRLATTLLFGFLFIGVKTSGDRTEGNNEMIRHFAKEGSPKQPQQPDDHYLGSMIASVIDGFVSLQGLTALLDPKTAICLSNEYRVFLSQAIETLQDKQQVRAFVYLKDLKALARYQRVMNNPELAVSPLSYITADQVAAEALRILKEQLGR